jgi:hypothetical protein
MPIVQNLIKTLTPQFNQLQTVANTALENVVHEAKQALGVGPSHPSGHTHHNTTSPSPSPLSRTVKNVGEQFRNKYTHVKFNRQF